MGNVGAIADGGCHIAQLGDEGFGTTVETAADHHRVGASSDHFEAFGDDGLCKDGCGGGTVAGDVIGLGGDFDQQASAHVFEWVFEFDFFCDRDTVVGDGRSAELLVDGDVAAAGSQGGLDGVSDGIYTTLEGATSLFVEIKLLRHVFPLLKSDW